MLDWVRHSVAVVPASRITIKQPLLLGLNDPTLQKAAAGTLPEQRQVGLIGSGAAILAAYLIAS